MVKRGISFDNAYDRWCDYRNIAAKNVFKRTIRPDYDACAMSWRTERALWVPEESECDLSKLIYSDWTFRSYEKLTDRDIDNFCFIHDINHLVDRSGWTFYSNNIIPQINDDMMDI